MKKIRYLIALLVVLVLTLVGTVPVYAASTADVTVTATGEYLAMTNSTSNWTMGSIAESTLYWWTDNMSAPAEPFADANMKSIVTNTGSVISDVKIHGHNFATSAAWALDVDGSPGADNVTIRYGITGCANEAAMTYLTLSDVEIMDSLAATAGHQHWCMNLRTGTFTDGQAESGVITLTIFKHV